MLKIMEVAAIDATIYSFVLPLMESLRGEGFEISFASADTGFSNKIESRGFTFNEIKFVRSLSLLGNILAFVQLVKLMRRERPDIVHTHTPIASVLARCAAKLCGVPHVCYTLHGLKTQPVLLLVEKLACRFLTDHIFAVNKNDARYLCADNLVSRNKITLLNGIGIDTVKFNRKNIEDLRIAGLKKELGLGAEPVIGFVGRLIKEKGIEELVEAFSVIRKRHNCKLLLVGSADLNERDSKTILRIKRIINRKGLEPDVVFAGYRTNMPEMLALMTIFALPSYIEGMCVSTLEAMAMELPIVATDIRGIREEVTADCGILVEPGDSAGLAGALETLLQLGKDADKYGKNGRKRVVRIFGERKALNVQVEAFKRISGLVRKKNAHL